MRSKWLVCFVVLAGCPDVSTDNNDTAAPVVEFDPLNSIIPFPNNLVISPVTGKVSIPPAACESDVAKATRENVLNKLDGFGTYEVPITVSLSDMPDDTTLAGSVHLYQRGPTPSTTEIPVVAFSSTSLRFDATDCTATPAQVPELVVVPKIPLDPNSTYTLAVVDSLKTADGRPFKASFVWGLTRQSKDPVTLSDNCDPTTYANCVVTANNTPIPEPASADPTDPNLAQLVGIDTLWKAHAQALAFLDTTGMVAPNRANLLVATDFTTQTTTKPLDPSVSGSPASKVTSGHLVGLYSVPDAVGASCNTGQGCTAFFTAEGLPCGSLPCDAVGDVFGGGMPDGANFYQTKLPNAFAPSMPIPGAWDDPVNPSTSQGGWQKTGAPPAGVLEVLAVIPNASQIPGPWPVVIYQHGLTRHKEDLLGIAAQLAKLGFASIAIDNQLHGSRAIPISNDPLLGCAGTCFAGATDTMVACDTITPCGTAGEICVNAVGNGVDPPNNPQCYYPVISANLDATRDSIRQTVLDQMVLYKAVIACGTTGCTTSNANNFAVQPDHIVYLGHSLGSFVGAITNSMTSDVKATVLDVGGVGIPDVLEHTPNAFFRAFYVNALIDAGIVMGTKCSATDPTVGSCANNDWQKQPAFQQFAGIQRWVLDPGDPANYVSPHPGFAGMAAKKFLFQEVIGDQVVPNLTSDNEGALLGQTAMQADPATSVPPPASTAVTTNAMTSKWVQYPFVAPAAPSFPGNSFSHGSLLKPNLVCSITKTTQCSVDADCPSGETCSDPNPGTLGTLRIQSDAFTFLFLNK